MRKRPLHLLLVLLVLLSSCVPPPKTPRTLPSESAPTAQEAAPDGSQGSNATTPGESGDGRKALSARLTPAKSVFSKPPGETAPEPETQSTAPQPSSLRPPLAPKQAKPRVGVLGQGGQTGKSPLGEAAAKSESGTLSFDKADIAEVTHQIFGDHLQLNYILDPAIKGVINLHMEGEFSREQLLQMVVKAFQEVNVEVTHKDGIYYIKPMTPINRNLELADPSALGAKHASNPMIVVYRPRFIQAQQGLNLIKSFLTPGRASFHDQGTNTIVFVENVQNARSVLELLKAMDINLLDEIGMEILPLKVLTPVEAVKTMTTVMGQLGVFRGTTFKDNLVMVPLDHYRGVLIFAQDQAVLEIAKQWLTAIDVRGSELGEQINIYQVENALARDISDILGQVFGKEKAKAQKTLKNKLVGATSSAPETSASTASTSLAATTLGASASGAEVIDTELTGPLTLIADEINNSLIIRSNSRDYATVKRVIQKLDTMPRAVLIEVVIAEVRLKDSLQYGVEWFLKSQRMGQGTNRFNGLLSSSNSLGTFDFGSAALGSLGGLSGLTAFLGTDSIQALISLLDKNTDVNVLATPSILALDNNLASITVGGREPTVTQQQQSTTTTANIINSVQYQETGLVLRVIPHISSSGVVRMEVEQKIKSVNDETLKNVNLNTPRFTEREIKTSLVTEDGKTVVLGGLISASKTRSVDGIPILGQLPVLGFFFAKNSKDVEKTELLVSITPHVVKPRHDAVQNELLQRLEHLRRNAKAK